MVVVGQQKLSGSPSWLHDAKPGREHVLALGISPITCAAFCVAKSAVIEGMVVERRHNAVRLSKFVRPMVILCDELDMKKIEWSVASPIC